MTARLRALFVLAFASALPACGALIDLGDAKPVRTADAAAPEEDARGVDAPPSPDVIAQDAGSQDAVSEDAAPPLDAALDVQTTGAPCNPDFFDLPTSTFQSCFDYWAHRGLFPQTLTVSRDGMRMSGSFQYVTDRGEVHSFITAEELDALTISDRARGWMPRDVTEVSTDAGLRYLAITAPSGGSDVFALRDDEEADFNATWTSLYNQGYTQSYWFIRDDNGLKFSASWSKRPAFNGFAAYYGFEWTDFVTRDATYADQGLRLDHLTTFKRNLSTYYAGIWIPSAENRFADVTSSGTAYDASHARIAGTYGYRLHQLHAFDQDSFAAVWVGPHGVCSTGMPLLPESDPCITQICATDAACCEARWEAACVAKVSSVCHRTCP